MSGVINGTNYMVLLNGKYAMLMTSHSISFEQGTRDISVRETNNWSKYILFTREWTIDMEGLYAQTYEDGTVESRHTTQIGLPPVSIQIPPIAGHDIIYSHYINQEKVWLGFVDFTTGAKAWEGQGYLTSVNIDAPNEDNTTISMSFQGINNPRMSGVTNQDPADRPTHSHSHY
tara:strand:+ start:10388 stop:10909 length:522 start_codon:yes stop_codon:yes gene_type:complete